MILLCGIPTETPLAMISDELGKLNVPYEVFNQRHFADMDMEFEITAGRVTGWLREQGRAWRLENIAGVFLRLMDDRFLPELDDEPVESESRRYCRALHDVLTRWTDITPARVVNKIAPMGSNGSKSYQAQLISEYGFDVPETLITNDPDTAIEFWRSHDHIIYKSVSGVRSIVQTMSKDDLDRLHQIRWCPTQFQEFVEGDDIRVHVIKSAVFATKIQSEATDYRYAKDQVDTHALLEACELPDEVADRCVQLAKGLGLSFAGIDLRISPDGRVTCFEVNPCPAFSYYEGHTRQPIAQTVARYLAGK